MSGKLTHFDDQGRPNMVDVSEKSVTARTAIAEGEVCFSPEAFEGVKDGTVKKGDITKIAQLAGIMGAKRTSDLIPLCHPLPLSAAHIDITPQAKTHSFLVRAQVKTSGRTGVEMEALTAVSTACLTIYDMCKAIDKSIFIRNIRLIEKTGGKSGTYQFDPQRIKAD